LRDGIRLPGKRVPVIIARMMDTPNTLWGNTVYPVVAPEAWPPPEKSNTLTLRPLRIYPL
jgi:hypothetical protein